MNGNGFHILLVEDDASVREAVAGVLRDEGYAVQTAVDGQEAISTLQPGTDLVVADLAMPRMDGRQLLRWVMQNHPGTAVILMTGYGTIPQAVDAIKAGATAYLTKPLDPEELLLQVKKALEDKRLRQELSHLRGQLREGWHYRNIIGKSPAMQQVFALIDRAAGVKTTVLIIGESGTGKEMVARALHESGPRKSGPFLALNCGAIPENLIESTLFGHERGAFTGADQKARGYFQAANGGTLLLDEIGELPLGLQSKLLRVLEEGAVTPVGTTTPQKVDVRIVAATARDLETEVKEDRFRQDLYFRLNVVKIQLPPLRQRLEDLPLMSRHFLDEICRQNGFEPREIDPSLLEAFSKYDWPGNVRELKNLLESLVVLSGKRMLTAEDLPERLFPQGAGDDGEDTDAGTESELNLTRLSKQAILKALEACHGNRTEAAKQLGISRRTLHRRLNEFGLRE
ncbi:MAG TPA: sigma-54 dependent transcriptional regulator [Tepidisphaeraceae bacterium]|nr:sigma-54 dependent transcriptional regulator [Tepidisphaeraceae bacterium]